MHTNPTNPTNTTSLRRATQFQWPSPKEMALIAASTLMPYVLAAILLAV